MTMLTRDTARDAGLDAVFNLLNSGTMRIGDGTKPATVTTALGAQVNLADLPFGNPAFAASASASKVANAITQDSAANASGTASWAGLYVSGQAFSGNRNHDLSCGTSGQDLNFNSTGISSGAAVQCTGLTMTQAA